MIGVRPVRFRPPRVKQWNYQGWGSMYDSREATAEVEGEAPLYINLDPIDPNRPGALALRPGLHRMATPTTLQLPTAAIWQGAGWGDFGGFNNFKNIVVAGGEIYNLNISNNTLTKEITAAQLTAAGISLSTTSMVYIVPYRNTVIISSDLGEFPFTWDGTVGGGLTKLTAAPLSRQGPATIYYGKVFWIKANSATIVWSEEGQPNVGYESGGYNNAWDLNQTGAAPIIRLLGTNDGLYVFRLNSVGVIRGAVSTTFQSDGTHDSISTQAGIDFFTVPVEVDGTIFWQASTGRSYAYRPDLGAVDLTRSIPRRHGPGEVSAAAWHYLGDVGEEWGAGQNAYWVLADRGNQQVHFEHYGFATTLQRVVTIYDVKTLHLRAIHVYPAGVNVPVSTVIRPWAFITHETGGTTPQSFYKIYCDKDGYIFEQKILQQNPSIDGFDNTESGTGTAVVGTWIGPMAGWSTGTEWQFTQIDLVTDAFSLNSLSVQYVTSRQHKDHLAGVPPGNVMNLAGDVATDTPFERRRAFGINATGRWLRPIVKLIGQASAPTDRQPVLHAVTITGIPMSATPAVS